MDTICYARKAPTGLWVRYGNPFDLPHGIRSASPFVESFGDSIYLVWQEKESPIAQEEVWRGRRHRIYYQWFRDNLSSTPTTLSLFPVNASALYTVFMDESDSYESFDVFMKVRPSDPLTNLSQTMYQSYYPQSVAKFTIPTKYLYTLYQEGLSNPCEIKISRWDSSTPRSDDDDIAFLSSFSGDSVMSPYLTARDGYNSNWQVPTDYGNQKLTYRLPLDPAYLYKAKVIAYHERTNQWKALCKIDGGNQLVIRYNPHIPETLAFWIPPNLYQDSVIDVTMSKVVGDFVSMGQIYIYRYEAESGGNGGPQSSSTGDVRNADIQLQVSPNPISHGFTITYALLKESTVDVSIYDAAGRMVKALVNTVKPAGNHREAITNLNLPSGIYFVRLRNDQQVAVNKVVIIE
jgi:hypothetical protein